MPTSLYPQQRLTFFHYDPTYQDSETESEEPEPESNVPLPSEVLAIDDLNTTSPFTEDRMQEGKRNLLSTNSTPLTSSSVLNAVEYRSNALSFMNRARRYEQGTEERRRDDDEEQSGPDVDADEKMLAANVEGMAAEDDQLGHEFSRMSSIGVEQRSALVTPQKPSMATEDAMSPQVEEDLSTAVEVVPTPPQEPASPPPGFLAETDSSCRHKRAYDENTRSYVWFCGCPHHSPQSAGHHRQAERVDHRHQTVEAARPPIEGPPRHSFQPKVSDTSEALDAAAFEKRMNAMAAAVDEIEPSPQQPLEMIDAMSTPSASPRGVSPSSSHPNRTGRWELLFREAAAKAQRHEEAREQHRIQILAQERLALRGTSVHRNVKPVTTERFKELHEGASPTPNSKRLSMQDKMKETIAGDKTPSAKRSTTPRGPPALSTATRGTNRLRPVSPPKSEVVGKPTLSPGTSKHLKGRDTGTPCYDRLSTPKRTSGRSTTPVIKASAQKKVATTRRATPLTQPSSAAASTDATATPPQQQLHDPFA